MKKSIIVITFMIILIGMLALINSMVVKKNDFRVTISVDENYKTKATITYIGNKDEVKVYHGAGIFYFSVNEKDGKYIFKPGVPFPQGHTILIKNKPYIREFELPNSLLRKMVRGKDYEFNIYASFSFKPNGKSKSFRVSSIVTH